MQVFVNGDRYSNSSVRHQPAIFLAGPSKRPKKQFVSYRQKLIDKLKDHNVTIFNPEYIANNPSDDIQHIFRQSQEWELKAINLSDVIVCGLNTDIENIGTTTRTEVGFLMMFRRNLVFYRPSDSVQTSYIYKMAVDKGFPVHDNLDEVIETVKKQLSIVPLISNGSFDSKIVKTNYCDPVVLKKTVERIINEYTFGAIYVHVPYDDTLNWKEISTSSFDFKFHRHDKITNEWIFYKWNDMNRQDPTPEAATSINGACAIVLNNDESKLLWIYEESYGKKWWKFVSGAVDSGELIIEAMARELKEEVGLTVDLTKLPVKLVGGYNKKRARFGYINDLFLTFVINIDENSIIKPDGVEVKKFAWLNVEDVLSGKTTHIDGVELNRFNLNTFKTYMDGKAHIPCRIDGEKMIMSKY